MWCVVAFRSDDFIRIVCQKWFVNTPSEDSFLCHYPTDVDGSKVNNLLIQNGPPHPTWPVVAVDILKDNIGSLLDARKIARKAEEEESELSLTDPENLGRGRRKRKQRVISSSEDENTPPLSKRQCTRQVQPSESLLNIQSLNWPTTCIDKNGGLPLSGPKKNSSDNSTPNMRGFATSTQKVPGRSSVFPRSSSVAACNTAKNSVLPSVVRNKKSQKRPENISSNVQGFATSTQKAPIRSSVLPNPSSDAACNTAKNSVLQSVVGTKKFQKLPEQNASNVQGFAPATQKVPLRQPAIPKSSSNAARNIPISSNNSTINNRLQSKNVGGRPVDLSIGNEILQKLFILEGQFKRIEATSSKTLAKVIAMTNITEDLPDALSSIQNKMSELIISEEQNKREDILAKVPLEDIATLANFEANLMNAKFRSSCVKYLATQGTSKSVSLCVKKIMRVLLTDELAREHSMTGHMGKLPFNTKKLLCEAIAAATRSLHPVVTDEDVWKSVSEWLTKAKERLSSKAKVQPDDTTDDIDELLAEVVGSDVNGFQDAQHEEQQNENTTQPDDTTHDIDELSPEVVGNDVNGFQDAQHEEQQNENQADYLGQIAVKQYIQENFNNDYDDSNKYFSDDETFFYGTQIV